MFLKRLVDFLASLILLIILSPFMIVIGILTAKSSPGPVFFKQDRVTKDGRVFKMYKFRSMRVDIPEGEAHWTEENDPRITKFGQFIRDRSIDELPQLINVLKGDMSLVGPRPERPELTCKFEKEIARYSERNRMKAGMTGWAQINGFRGNTSLEKRVECDNYYIDNWSLALDIKILIKTFLMVI